MKSGITPLMIFLLLLLILVIFLVCNKMCSTTQESFVSFLHDESISSQHTISQYDKDKQLYKLYDHIFYDSENGSIIEVDSTEYDSSNDESGETITGLTVIHRNSNSANVYSIASTEDIIDEQPRTMKSSYRVLMYETVNKNTDRYKIVYMPFGKKTLIYIFNNTANPIASEAIYYFDENKNMKYVSLSGKKIFLDDFTADDDRENNREVLEREYNDKNPVFQISKYVQIDPNSGNIIVRNKETNQLKIHTRKNEDPDNMQVNVYEDVSGGNSIFSVENDNETMLFILGKNEYDIVTIKNLKYFEGDKQLEIDDKEDDEETDDKETDNEDQQPVDRNKYLLKTEIVPPVCPKCPKCPEFPDSKELCFNCGGQGGSGTMNDTGNSLIEKDSISKNREMETKNKEEVSDKSNKQKNDTETPTPKNTIPPSAANTYTPPTPAQQPTPTPTPTRAQQPTPTAPVESSTTATSQPIEKTDPYSYNGQLPSKGFNNFLPRTANFSSFGK